MSANYAVLGLAFVLAGPLTDMLGARWVYAGAAGDDPVGGRRRNPPGRAASRRRPSGRADPDDMTRDIWTTSELVDGVRAGETRALARAISLVEDGDPAARELVGRLYAAHGTCPRGRLHGRARASASRP